MPIPASANRRDMSESAIVAHSNHKKGRSFGGEDAAFRISGRTRLEADDEVRAKRTRLLIAGIRLDGPEDQRIYCIPVIGQVAAPDADFALERSDVDIAQRDAAMLGEMLVTDPRVDVISFTGSTGVGRRIMEKGAPTLKRLFLELGGKSASIIFEDAPNFAEAVGQSIVCYHAGQGCATITRLLVPESRYAEAVMVLEHAYAAYGQMWGKAEDPTNFMGPLISER